MNESPTNDQAALTPRQIFAEWREAQYTLEHFEEILQKLGLRLEAVLR